MKKIIFVVLFTLILGTNVISYAHSSEPFGPLPWDYDHNDNVPGFVDKNGDPIPNIVIDDDITMVDVYGNWAQEAITYCAKQGYLDGMLTRKYFFSPPSTIDKSDLAVLLGRRSNIAYDQYTNDCFSDISLEYSDLSGAYDYSDWYSNFTPYYVNWAGAEGLLKGSGQGGALNKDELNREQAATIIDRYITKYTNLYAEMKTDGSFTYHDQAQISDWAKESIERLSTIKLFNGDEKGNFNPEKYVSRSEICQLIYNLDQAEAPTSSR